MVLGATDETMKSRDVIEDGLEEMSMLRRSTHKRMMKFLVNCLVKATDGIKRKGCMRYGTTEQTGDLLAEGNHP